MQIFTHAHWWKDWNTTDWEYSKNTNTHCDIIQRGQRIATLPSSLNANPTSSSCMKAGVPMMYGKARWAYRSYEQVNYNQDTVRNTADIYREQLQEKTET